MISGKRIHAVTVAFAVGYLFFGGVVARSEGVLRPNVSNVLIGAAFACVVWMRKDGAGRKQPSATHTVTSETDSHCAAVTVPLRESALAKDEEVPTPRRLRDSGTPLASIKGRSELAFSKGRIVEAVYWLEIARLRGDTDRSGRMRKYVSAWQCAGCPQELDNVHVGFTRLQGSFGRAVLRFWSKGKRKRAIERFMQMAQDGDRDAKAFLEMNRVKAEIGGVA